MQPSSITPTKLKENTAPDTAQKKTDAINDSVKKAASQVQKSSSLKQQLQWSLVSRIGRSNTVEPIAVGFGGLKSSREANLQVDYSSGGNYMPGSSADSAARRLPATPTKGFHFAMGGIVKKGIGKRSFITVGLLYAYYSNHLSVGTQLPVDSVAALQNSNAFDVRKVFRNNGGNNNNSSNAKNRFTNAFHFIELPIGFEYLLLKNVPLQMQHGITISQLVASRALQYDSRANLYYQSKTDLRKTSFNVFTAATFTVWKGKTFSLKAGPHLQYGLQSIFKNASGGHLISGGVALNAAF